MLWKDDRDKLKNLLSALLIFCLVMLLIAAARASNPSLEQRWRGLIILLTVPVAIVLVGWALWHYIPIVVLRIRLGRGTDYLYPSQPPTERSEPISIGPETALLKAPSNGEEQETASILPESQTTASTAHHEEV